jgi:hypothetical protein
LVGEVSCQAATLREALEASASAVLVTAHVMSFIANAFVGNPEIELGFDATPGVTEREFFQRRLLPGPDLGGLVPGRALDPATAGPFHAALAAHPDVSRLLAAINHYSLALASWRPGMEVLALAPLWMGIENVTGAVLRAHLASRQLSEEQLMGEWGIKERRNLRPEIRRRLIFHGDSEAYSAALEASDGFEHGFLDLATVRKKAQQTHVIVAQRLREAIVNLLTALGPEIRTLLLGTKFQRPRGPLMADHYFWGKIVGAGVQLAAEGARYPRLDWSTRISTVAKNEDGSWSFAFEDNLTVRCGPDVQMKPERREVWDASLALDRLANTKGA